MSSAAQVARSASSFRHAPAHRYPVLAGRTRSSAARNLVRAQYAAKPTALVVVEYAVAILCCVTAAYLSFQL